MGTGQMGTSQTGDSQTGSGQTGGRGPRRHAREEWPPAETQLILGRLGELSALVQEQARIPDNQEVASWLARLLVVRSCGYLEQTVVVTSRAYISRTSNGMVRNFALGALKRAPNPSADALGELALRFDPALKSELRALLGANDQRLRRELNYLVELRNKIAHGQNENVGVAKALILKEVACEVADWYILRFRPR
ncbi:HEPN domain-containing protein [Frankia sp. R43]|uniref:HEPN domain-containing protein n=1 Tax=Frankia sp. R43 TaxID=269536 RepID=UPI001F3CFA6B|nr:HEPN domain-containing protein [Frankia sp. R43]